MAAKELQRQLGVTYKCAWRIGHQLRGLMAARDKANNPGQLSGQVEIDETYVGGHRRKKHPSGKPTESKTPVMGLVERGGVLKGHVLPDMSKPTLLTHIFKDVALGATVSTDQLQAYKKLGDHGYTHGAVRHQLFEWSKDGYSTNRTEGFWRTSPRTGIFLRFGRLVFSGNLEGTQISLSQR